MAKSTLVGLSDESFKQIQKWNRDIPKPIQSLVHQLISVKALEQPDAPAVCWWDGNLTYAELDEYSSRLAGQLIFLGVGLGDVVSICFEKSVWAVVSMLAVLKSGAVWTPLDISLPVARLSTIVLQTRSKVALTSATNLDKCKALVSNTVVVDGPAILRMTLGTELRAVSPTDAAYIIFTSGSTGSPKGVVIEHSQLSSMAIYCGAALGYGHDARVLQFASYAFDACVSDIFGTLVHGGCICVPKESDRNDRLVEVMRRMRVTHVLATPSLWGSLDVQDVPSLATLMLGGEAVPATLIQEWSQKLRLIVAYGPTECTVMCYISDISNHHSVTGEIGRSVGARGWIVKENSCNELAEVGEPGELLIEGPGVGRGYLDDREKTERSFIQAPGWMQVITGSPATSRLYRTGDLVRYLDNGRVCFMGRIDNQVKIRGFRIELEEIETQLGKDLVTIDGVDVRNLIVEAVTFSGLTTNHLVAFICLGDVAGFGCLEWEPEDGPVLTTSAREREAFAGVVSKLSETLPSTLPKYAIPSLYIPLRDVPITLSGKTDRKRLRAAAAVFSTKQLAIFSTPQSPLTPPDSESSSTLPDMTATEGILQSLWASIFQIPASTIELGDNFFHLGGDSILVIKLVSTARSIGLELTFQMVFKHPVLDDLAQAAKKAIVSEPDFDGVLAYSLLPSYEDVKLVRQQAAEKFGIAISRIEDIYPCSSMQSALYALSMKVPGAYKIQLVYTLPSDVDLAKLQSAWDAVVARSQILRTRFVQGSAELLQVVVDEQIQWQVLEQDLAKFLEAEKEKETKIGQRMSYYTILPSHGTLQRHLVWTVHHSLVDAWCVSGIANAVEQEYLGSLITESGPKFNTFIRYLRQQDEGMAQDFWKRQLAEAPTGQSFPPLPHVGYRAHASSVVQRNIPAVKRESMTAATLIQVAWSVLVGIYTSCNDVVIGVTLNGRTIQLPGVESIMGPTLNTVPLRMRLDPEEKVVDLLRRTQDQYLDMIPFQHFGLEKIRRLGADFNAVCDFQSLLIVQSTLHSQETTKVLASKGTMFTSFNQPLILECEPSGEIIQVRATFDERIICETRVQRIIHQLEDILRRISISGPDARVVELQLIGEPDLRQILRWNNNNEAPRPVRSCVHHLIEQRARQRSDSQAVCAWDGELSYQQLEEYSSQLASHLRSTYSVGPETLVPVCFEKSLWVVVAMLAVLKAGGACVPMDPSHPTTRCRAMISRLGDKSANVVLTSVLHGNRVTEFGLPALEVGPRLMDTIGNLLRVTDGVVHTSAAFVVFTSGSTGTPKGIVLEHEAFCSSAIYHGPLIGLDEQTRVLQFSAHTFDVSIGDIFSTLIFGGCVCIPSEHDRMNNLGESIVSLKANHMLLTPVLASHLRPEDAPGLRTLTVAGELMIQEVFDTWADRVNLIQLYGPAECTVYCLGTKVADRYSKVNDIGKGFSALTWIVDPKDPNHLTPIGGVGELLLEGPVLARCYVGDELQTNSSFIMDPDWSMSHGLRLGRRFYKTGDLASYDDNGSILFLGRNDGQVKLRGQRIEIAEVEARLRECLAPLTDVAVTLLQPHGSEKMLAAYIVVQSDEPENDSGIFIARSDKALSCFRNLMGGIEAQLHSMLPKYMVPSVYIPIRMLPLSTSAKVDRRMLQDIASKLSLRDLAEMRGERADMSISEAPLTGMETHIRRLWIEVLGNGHISTISNFFQLGGDSIRAMRLVSIARKAGIRMTVNDVFEAPTLSALALRARYNVATADVPPLSLLGTINTHLLLQEAARQCTISPDDIEDIYPCSTMQKHYLIGYGTKDQKDPSDPVDWQMQLVFSLPTSLNTANFREIWNLAVYRHAALRTRVIETPDGIFQVVINPTRQPDWVEKGSLEDYLREDQADHMGYGTELLRLAMISPDNQGDRHFVMTALHCIYDGFALNMLFKEIEAANLQTITDSTPPRMNQFIKYMIEADRSAAVDFWTSYLSDAVTKPLLTAPRGYYPMLDMVTQGTTTDAPKMRPSEVTLSTMIELAGCLAIAHQLGCPDVILCSDRTGRNLPVDGIQDLIGPTTLYLPVRVHVEPKQKIEDLLRQAQSFQNAMIPFEHVGWLELNKMSSLEPALRNSVNMNVNPHPLDSLGKGLGLELKAINGISDDPFLIDVHVRPDGEVEWRIFYDVRLITHDRVEKLLKDITAVFSRLVDASSKPGLLVENILELL